MVIRSVICIVYIINNINQFHAQPEISYYWSTLHEVSVNIFRDKLLPVRHLGEFIFFQCQKTVIMVIIIPSKFYKVTEFLDSVLYPIDKC